MNIFGVLALIAALAAVVSLGSGVIAMTGDVEINHRTSQTWMGLRVAFQAAALILIVVSMILASFS
jgi:hypothetical protein